MIRVSAPWLVLLCSGTIAAADLTISGTPMAITVNDSLGVQVHKSGVRQYYDTYNTFLRVAGTTYHSCTALDSGFPNPPNAPFVAISHSKPDPWSIDTRATAGGLEITHLIAYTDGLDRFTHTWTVTNPTAGAIAGISLLYGGDTYFENDDRASGTWDPALNMIFCKRAGASGLMGIQGGATSPADAYLEGGYNLVWAALSAGSLGSATDANSIDNGMALQWNCASLAAGASWTISAIERWTPEDSWGDSPLTVSVTAGDQAGQASSMTDGSHGQGNVVGGNGLGNPGGTGIGSGTGSVTNLGIPFVLRFSAPVTGLDAGDLVVGGTVGGTVVSIDPAVGPADVYTVTVGGMTGPGDVSLAVLPGGVTDADGHSNAASAGGDPSTTWDGGPASSNGGGGNSCGGSGLALLLCGMLISLGLRRNSRSA